MTKRKATLAVVLLLTMVLFTRPQAVHGATETQTVHITHNRDDGFVTPVGVLMDTGLVHILDPNMDIRSFLVFHDIKINSWEKLNNVTLRLRSATSLPFDADSSVTVYGIKLDDLQLEGFLNPGFILSAPLTTASVNVNTSQFHDAVWMDIDVQNIVDELINHPNWDGDGVAGADTGDSIGFIIYGAQDEIRYFYSYNADPNRSADLVFYWGSTPPTPESQAPPAYQNQTWEFVNTSDRTVTNTTGGTETIDIFLVTEWGDPMASYIGYELPHAETYYQNLTRASGGETKIRDHDESVQDWSAPTILVFWEGWGVAVMDAGAGVGTTRIFTSDDEFATYDATADINLEYGLGGDSQVGSIALDRLDNTTFHVVWNSPTPGNPGIQNILYTNFTVNPLNGTVTFGPSYTNITDVAFATLGPMIYCDLNGSLHVVYYGTQAGTVVNQAWYRKRAENGTWLAQVQVSDAMVAGEHHTRPDVVANEDTGDALIVWEWDDTEVWWDIVFAENNTDGPDRVANTGNRPAMLNDRENNTAQLVWNTLIGPGADVYYQYKTIDNSSAWSANMAVSGAQTAILPGISIDPETNFLQSVWFTDAFGYCQGNYWPVGTAPIAGNVEQVTNQDLYYNYLTEEFSRETLNETYWIAWGNGTLIDGPFDSLDDVEEAIDEMLGAHPEDPNPPSQDWPTTGPFTRFRTRMYVFLVGFFCFWGPIWFFAWKRPDGYYLLVGGLIMLVGLGLMAQVVYV